MKPYIGWLSTTALPFWAERGFDKHHDRFHERLDLDGKPVDVAHRCMVQARQIYVYAHAAELGWHDAPALAERAFASLMRDFAVASGDKLSFRFSIGHGGSETRDAYAHAFVLLAIAHLYRVSGEKKLLDIARRTMSFIDADMRDARDGGLHDALPLPVSPTKRQNPHMHLLEGFLALEEAAPQGGFIDHATPLVHLLRDKLIDPRSGMLIEYFDADWRPHPDTTMRRCVEPGHHFEWAWLLARYDGLTGRSPDPLREQLFRSARRYGVSLDHRIHDEIDTAGDVVKRSTRLWPYTEAIKAAAVRHTAGDRDAAPFAEDMTRVMFELFLDRPFTGGWIDRRDGDGSALVDNVPASSLYHLMMGGAEARRFSAPPNLSEP